MDARLLGAKHLGGTDCSMMWHRRKTLVQPWMMAQHDAKHGLVSGTNALTSEQKRVAQALRLMPAAHFPTVPSAPNLQLPTPCTANLPGPPYPTAFTLPQSHSGPSSGCPALTRSPRTWTTDPLVATYDIATYHVATIRIASP